MNIGEVLNEVYDDEVGWRPASGSIKPVHVANGLVRGLFHRHYNNARLVELIVWWKRGGAADEDRTLDALVNADENEALGALASDPILFDRARRYLNGVLAADGGVFPSAKDSDLTLTCAQMASRSGNDRRLGEFAVALIQADDGEGALARVLRDALASSKPRDPITAAAWPLLDLEGSATSERHVSQQAFLRSHNATILRELRHAAHDLASHELKQGNRLRTLERAVQFACVATQCHAQALAANGDLAARIPGLLAALPGRDNTVAASSERILTLIWSHFEEWLGERLAERLRNAKPPRGKDGFFDQEPLDGRQYRTSVGQVGMAEQPHDRPDAETLAERMVDFTLARKTYEGDTWRTVAHALVQSHIREYESGGPRRFLQNLGRRVGLFYPYFQGRAREKRIRPSVGVLDMLVRACIPAGSMLPMEEFLERLWLRFGFVTGGRRTSEWDDSDALASHGIDVDTDGLVANHVLFAEQLESMGLARRYADNVTFVGDGHDV